MASQPPRTHCLRGHEFTAENTQWVNVPRVGHTARSRLCRICSRARARRYLDLHPPKYQPKPLPPLPDDLDTFEVELERYIRRVLRARLPQRAGVLWDDVESRLEHHGFKVNSELHRVPIRELARPKESFADYAARTSAGWDDYGDWFVCRMLDDPRIRAVLAKAQSSHTIVEPEEVKPRVPLRHRSGRPFVGRSATPPRRWKAACP